MKFLSIVIVLFSLSPYNAEAQIWNKIKEKAQKEAEKILSKDRNSTKTKKSKSPKNSDSKKSSETILSKNSVDVWRNYKFIPGEKVIFYDDLKFEEVGEFPSRWDLNEGGAEVAAFNGDKVIIGNSSHENTIFPLFNSKDYLTEQFTIDFDIYVDELSSENNNSWGYYNFFFTNEALNNKSRSVAEIEFGQRSGKTRGYVLEYDFQLNDVSLGQLKAWHHLAISYNKGNFKLYYDENRIANIPRLAITPEIFAIQMETVTNTDFLGRKLNYGIRNIRIAHGGGDMYKRIISDGKYVTNGILFDSGKTIVKPQSMGVINKFITILNEYPDWKFEIIGHTDNEGSETSNLKLSKERAESIKKIMVDNGIVKNRLITLGRGESEPLNSNSSNEEKCNNRRVEFNRL